MQEPNIYSSDQHQILLDQVDPQALYVIQKLKEAGYQAYLVGGGVRDLALGRRPKDYDVSTSARPEEIRSLFRNAILIGRRFRLAHIRFGKKVIEVSTFRAGDNDQGGLITHDNEWGSEEEDVLRRDFTINGLFYDPETEEIIDYVGGYPDLEKKILRSIGQPEKRFIQDPVRMIRLVKFCARFHFEVEPATFEALLACRQEIVKSSPARIFEELLRMLESGASCPFFHLLNTYGLLRPLSPILSRFLERKPEENPVFELLAEIDARIGAGAPPPDRALLLAALVFPLIDQHLSIRLEKGAPPPHLGIIAEESLHCIDAIFAPFFHLPRKMRGIVSFLLVTQYRLVPLDQRVPRRLRAPKDPIFPLALQLLEIRARLSPHLLPFYEAWARGGEAEAPPPRRGPRRSQRSDRPSR